MIKLSKEHQRMLNICKKATDNTSINVKDRILVFCANGQGLWVSDGNLGSKENLMSFLENILKELKS